MDFRTADGRIYQRRMVTRSKRGQRAAIAEVRRRRFVDYFAVDLGTGYAVYFAADPTLDRGTVRFVNRDGTEAGRIVNLKVERDAR